MKSFQKIIQGTKIWLPPHYNEKFLGHGFRKRTGKRSQEEMKRSRGWGGARGRKLVWRPVSFYYYCGGGISLGGGATLIRRPH